VGDPTSLDSRNQIWIIRRREEGFLSVVASVLDNPARPPRPAAAETGSESTKTCRFGSILPLTFAIDFDYIERYPIFLNSLYLEYNLESLVTDWSFNFTIDIDLDAAIAYAKIFGVWRMQTAVDYHEQFKRDVEPLIKAPWVRVVDLINWRMGTPEVVDEIGKHMIWCRKNNMIRQVHVVNDPVRYGQLQKMFEKGEAKDISSVFRTRVEAQRFLREQGFSVRSSYV
jgi:hypothetical protein